jgi:hypothetical protein
MLFKKRIPVEEYCSWTLSPLFSPEREESWESLRRSCEDPHLNAVDRDTYYINLRAILIQLMLIATTKNCSLAVSMDARVFVMTYLNEHGLSEVESLGGEYNRAFGTIGADGVEAMVLLFADKLTNSTMNSATKERFLAEFYQILKVFFDEFKSIKLIAVR